MAELSEKWWKANKAKTLLSEPLTAALKLYDAAEAERRKEPDDEAYAKAKAALPGVKTAIEATRAKCKPTTHKQTLGYLDDLKKAADQQLKFIADHYANMKGFHAALLRQFQATEQACKKFLDQQWPATLQAYVTEIGKMNGLVETVAETRFYGRWSGQLHQKVRGLDEVANRLLGTLGKPGNDPKKMAGMVDEIRKGGANMQGWLDKMEPPA